MGPTTILNILENRKSLPLLGIKERITPPVYHYTNYGIQTLTGKK